MSQISTFGSNKLKIKNVATYRSLCVKGLLSLLSSSLKIFVIVSICDNKCSDKEGCVYFFKSMSLVCFHDADASCGWALRHCCCQSSGRVLQKVCCQYIPNLRQEKEKSKQLICVEDFYFLFLLIFWYCFVSVLWSVSTAVVPKCEGVTAGCERWVTTLLLPAVHANF